MKSTNIVPVLAVVVCCLFGVTASGQSPIVKDVTINANEARIELNANQEVTYKVEVSGPQDYYFSQEVAKTSDLKISPNRPDGTAFEDGAYQIQLTPVYTLTDDQRNELISLNKQNDQAGIQAYRDANNLPTQVEGFIVNFGIRNGKFIEPNKHEGDLPPPTMFGDQTDFYSPDAIYASLNYIEVATPSQEMDKSLFAEDAQVFTQDIIVQGSICAGFDCNSAESFGFDTERLKENNLRIHFDDTSNSASFPGNDWRIVINDTSNGGANYFAIEDATAGRVPFKIEAGAPSNALLVDDSGNIGVGNANPVLEVHVTDGDSPSLRLEQDGSSGFTPQTWDVAGNETNFFVRNVTNSSHLPFRILAGSGTDDAIVIAGNGNVGLGDDSPDAALDVEEGDILVGAGSVNVVSGNVVVSSGKIGVNVTPTAPLDVVGAVKITGAMAVTGNGFYRGDNTFLCTTNTSFRTSTFGAILHVDATNTRVGIGTASPGHLLELAADDAVKPNGGSWAGPSDRRLKTDIRDFEDGLSQLMAIRPVRYHYNGLLDLPTDKEFIGVIAQEIQKVAPYTVRPLNHEGKNGEDYLAYDGSSLTYILVNAVQEQQNIIESQEKRIEELEASLSEVAQLREEVAALAKILTADASTQENTSKVTEDK